MDEILEISGNLGNYAIAMLILQEKAGLSYKEARAVLCGYRENPWMMAEEFGVTYSAVSNLIRRGERKMIAANISLSDILREYPMGELLVDPPPVGE
jgi:tRNA(His) 5'-end guanylyltransferase